MPRAEALTALHALYARIPAIPAPCSSMAAVAPMSTAPRFVEFGGLLKRSAVISAVSQSAGSARKRPMRSCEKGKNYLKCSSQDVSRAIRIL
jgi:hypothetical protein